MSIITQNPETEQATRHRAQQQRRPHRTWDVGYTYTPAGRDHYYSQQDRPHTSYTSNLSYSGPPDLPAPSDSQFSEAGL